MKRKSKIIISITIAVILLIAGFEVYLLLTPIEDFGKYFSGDLAIDDNTNAGKVFQSVQDCAVRQKGLFGYIESFCEKHDRVPESIRELTNEYSSCKYYSKCPLGPSYVIHPENYGKPNAVLISESSNHHENTFYFWVRGITPQVQTMGDGTIYLFKDGKIAHIDAKKN